MNARRRLTLCAALVAVVAMAPIAPRARAEEITAEKVRLAIERGRDYLIRSRDPKGTWKDQVPYTGAVTSLCTLALLNAGLETRHPVIQDALKYLRSSELKPDKDHGMTYSVSLQTMVFCAAEPKKDLLLIARNAKWLESKQITEGDRAGAWSYPAHGGGDNSNSQFALLALYEAERVGVEVNPRTWKLAHEYWRACQNENGSWSYFRGQPDSGSMTCAGITAMVITSGQLNLGDAEVKNGRMFCCGEQRKNPAIERGLEWLAEHFTVEANPSAGRRAPQTWVFYYLYGVERVGRMTGRRFIGKHDWYRAGAEKLVRDQDDQSGYWKGVGLSEDNPDIGTSLALLFLAKGRRPLLIAKLMHGPDNDWNHHRGDMGNLTAYVEQRWKRDLSWQVIDPAKADVDDLLQAPVLFISGREAPLFTPEEKRNLRDYVDRGGFIFAEACCGGGEFDAGFRRLMADVFPEPEFALRLLPMEHPVWHAEEPVDPDHLRKLWGIDVGCRTSVVYAEGDLSCQWELSKPGRDLKAPPEIKADIDAANSIGVNVLAYATNRELKYKYDQFKTPTVVAEDRFERGKMYVANIQHPGGCNAAPESAHDSLAHGGREAQDSRQRRAARPEPHRSATLQLPLGVHARPQQFPLHSPRAQATQAVSRTGRRAAGRLDLLQQGVQRGVSPGNESDLSRPAARAHRGEPSALRHALRRRRSFRRLPPAADASGSRRTDALGGARGRTAARGTHARQPPGGDLLALRSELCARVARFARVRGLHAGRRRPNRPKRDSVLAL